MSSSHSIKFISPFHFEKIKKKKLLYIEKRFRKHIFKIITSFIHVIYSRKYCTLQFCTDDDIHFLHFTGIYLTYIISTLQSTVKTSFDIKHELQYYSFTYILHFRVGFFIYSVRSEDLPGVREMVLSI